MTKPIQIELPTGLDVGPVNAYLFTTPEPILVDAGIQNDDCWDALSAGLAAQGLTPADLSRIVITHPHVDHYGLARRLAAASRADVWISTLGAPWLHESGDRWKQRLTYYRDEFLTAVGYPPDMVQIISQALWALWQLADPVPADRLVTFAPDAVLEMGGLSWQSLHLPGHTYPQTAFYQAETRQFLSADHLMATTPTPVVELGDAPGTRRHSLPQFLASHDRVAQLAIDWVYPGHGRPFTNPHAIIEHQQQRIHTRKEEAYALVAQGHAIPTDILDIMYAHQPPAFRFAGLWMLIGYLDLLLADGRIRCDTIDGVWHYSVLTDHVPKEQQPEGELAQQ